MRYKKNINPKRILIINSLIAANLYSFAYSSSIEGLDEILNEPPSSQTSQAIPTPVQAMPASEVPNLLPAPQNTQINPQAPIETNIIPPSPPPASQTRAVNDIPRVEPNPNGQGSVFIFPLPLEKVELPPSRPIDSQQTADSPATSSEIISIITDAEIQEYLGDGPFPDNGPNHQVVRLKAEFVPLAPPRPIESILADAESQPIIVDAPLNVSGGLLLSATPNPAMRGKTVTKIVINTPPSRPKGLKAPKGSSLPSIEDTITAPTIRTGGRINIKYKRIRYQKIGKCSVRNVRQVTAVGKASIIPAAIMNKDFSIKVARFERDVLQPAARRHYGVPVTQMKHLSAYRCTNIAGTRNLSEHSKANALDVSTFVFADGRSVSLTKGWRGSRKERKFLRELQAGACKIFGTTLTPNYNRAHYNHFHFDAKSRKSKAICK